MSEQDLIKDVKEHTEKLIDFLQNNQAEYKDLFVNSIILPDKTLSYLKIHSEMLNVIDDRDFSKLKPALDICVKYYKDIELLESSNDSGHEGGEDNVLREVMKRYHEVIKKTPKDELLDMLHDEVMMVRRMTGNDPDDFSNKLRDHADNVLNPLREIINKGVKVNSFPDRN